MTDRHTRTSSIAAFALAVGVSLGTLLAACQEPAGLPPTLDPGMVTFTFAGAINGTFTVDGRCYWSDGYPPADSSCALAMEVGDTIRIRAVRDHRTLRWRHFNLDLPAAGTCGTAGCRIAFDHITLMGKVDEAYRSSETTVTVLEETADRIRGTFSARAYLVDGQPDDTLRITDGAFDVPVDR